MIYKDSFLITPPYECRYTSIEEVPEYSVDMSKYDFYVWDSQFLRKIRTKSNEFSSKKKYEQDVNKKENQISVEIQIVEVSIIDMADALSSENGIAVIIRDFIITVYHQTSLFVRN